MDALKGPAEELRIALSFADNADYSTYDRNLNLGQDDNGEDIDLEITITKDQLIDAIGEQYQKAVNICKNLLERNGLTGKDLSSLILVGGPTYSPIIRDMLKEEVTQNVDTSINPMTAVARGADSQFSVFLWNEPAIVFQIARRENGRTRFSGRTFFYLRR